MQICVFFCEQIQSEAFLDTNLELDTRSKRDYQMRTSSYERNVIVGWFHFRSRDFF